MKSKIEKMTHHKHHCFDENYAHERMNELNLLLLNKMIQRFDHIIPISKISIIIQFFLSFSLIEIISLNISTYFYCVFL